MQYNPYSYHRPGYDTGVMGSVLALKSFKEDFGLPTGSSGFDSSKNAQISSNVVSLLTAGCFFGAIAGNCDMSHTLHIQTNNI